MRKLLILASLILAIGSASAQQASLDRGGVQLNGGFGFTGWGIPVYLGLDFGVAPQVTVGGELFYRTDKIGGVRYNNFGVLANGNYHFDKLFRLPSQVDVYAGMGLGFFISSSSSGYTGDGYSGFNARIHTGGRYFFSNSFGVNLELGAEVGQLNNGIAKVGITYKF